MQITNQIGYLVKVSKQINKLITGNEKNKNKFCDHIDKVIKEAEKYGQYLRAEWQRAKEAGLTQIDENKDEEKWFWWTAHINDTMGTGGRVYFADDEFFVHFYMEGKPKPDPLDYLESMLWGSVGQVYEGLELLDYRFVLLAIIHDAQNWPAGQERIYFNYNPLEHVERKTLSDRLCYAVWRHLVEKFQKTPFSSQDVQQTIETSLLTVKAKLAIAGPLQHNTASEKPTGASGIETQKDGGQIEPKPPEILQKILWILKYGRKHWWLILLAILLMLFLIILPRFF